VEGKWHVGDPGSPGNAQGLDFHGLDFRDRPRAGLPWAFPGIPPNASAGSYRAWGCLTIRGDTGECRELQGLGMSEQPGH
jgi:hypothetical protein